MASNIRKRVADFASNSCTNETPEKKGSFRSKPRNPTQLLSQAVAAKLEDGNLKAAIRILASDEAYAAPSTEGLAKLRLSIRRPQWMQAQCRCHSQTRACPSVSQMSAKPS